MAPTDTRMKLTREALLGRPRKTKEITLPDGDTIHVRELSAGDVGEYIRRHKAAEQTGDHIAPMAYLVARAACDENGKTIFTDQDIDQIKGLNLVTIKAIADAAAELSGLSDDEKKGDGN